MALFKNYGHPSLQFRKPLAFADVLSNLVKDYASDKDSKPPGPNYEFIFLLGLFLAVACGFLVFYLAIPYFFSL